jgi:hypothetical protein
MPDGVEVRPRMTARRRIAAAHVAAFKAHAQMQPLLAQFKALFATLRLRLHILQVLRNMTATRCRHPNLRVSKPSLLND